MKKLAISMAMCVSVGMCNGVSALQNLLLNECGNSKIYLTKKYILNMPLNSKLEIFLYGDAREILGTINGSCVAYALESDTEMVKEITDTAEENFVTRYKNLEKLEREAAKK